MLTCSSIYRWTRVCLLIEVFVLAVCVCVFVFSVCVAFCCMFVFFMPAVVWPVVVAAVTIVVVSMSRQHLKLETFPVPWPPPLPPTTVWDVFWSSCTVHQLVYINQLAGVANLWHFIDICGLIFALTGALCMLLRVWVCVCECVRVNVAYVHSWSKQLKTHVDISNKICFNWI